MPERTMYYVTVGDNGNIHIESNDVSLWSYDAPLRFFCTAVEGTEEYQRIKVACMEAANALRALDAAVKAVDA